MIWKNEKKSFQGFSNITYNLVTTTYSQPPHNSCDLHISMWMMTEMTETQCTVSQAIERLPHLDSTIWNVTHTIHAVLFLFFQGMKSLVWAKTNRQESHTSEIKHIWTLLLYFHDIVFHVLSLGGFVEWLLRLYHSMRLYNRVLCFYTKDFTSGGNW